MTSIRLSVYVERIARDPLREPILAALRGLPQYAPGIDPAAILAPLLGAGLLTEGTDASGATVHHVTDLGRYVLSEVTDRTTPCRARWRAPKAPTE